MLAGVSVRSRGSFCALHRAAAARRLAGAAREADCVGRRAAFVRPLLPERSLPRAAALRGCRVRVPRGARAVDAPPCERRVRQVPLPLLSALREAGALAGGVRRRGRLRVNARLACGRPLRSARRLGPLLHGAREALPELPPADGEEQRLPAHEVQVGFIKVHCCKFTLFLLLTLQNSLVLY